MIGKNTIYNQFGDALHSALSKNGWTELARDHAELFRSTGEKAMLEIMATNPDWSWGGRQ